MARLTIDIELDNYLFDIEEGHMETTFLVYRSLIPELQRTGDVKSCRILVSEGKPAHSEGKVIKGDGRF